MKRANLNFGPTGLSVLLHVIIFASMIIGIDYARPTPFTPLAIKATLVQDIPETQAPPVVEPEPEPEPVIEEPEPEPEPEPDNSEELRRLAEEEKRRQDALLEQQRLEELKKKEEEDRKRREREEAERKKQEEEELERKRQEAERKRQEDIRRQREENERRRREEEERLRAAEIEAEERRIAAENSPAMMVYQSRLSQRINRFWNVPPAAEGTRCVVMIQQTPTGEVIGARMVSCDGGDVVERSILAAVRSASPLPVPQQADLYRRDLRLTMVPPE